MNPGVEPGIHGKIWLSATLGCALAISWNPSGDTGLCKAVGKLISPLSSPSRRGLALPSSSPQPNGLQAARDILGNPPTGSQEEAAARIPRQQPQKSAGQIRSVGPAWACKLEGIDPSDLDGSGFTDSLLGLLERQVRQQWRIESFALQLSITDGCALLVAEVMVLDGAAGIPVNQVGVSEQVARL